MSLHNSFFLSSVTTADSFVHRLPLRYGQEVQKLPLGTMIFMDCSFCFFIVFLLNNRFTGYFVRPYTHCFYFLPCCTLITMQRLQSHLRYCFLLRRTIRISKNPFICADSLFRIHLSHFYTSLPALLMFSILYLLSAHKW